MSVSTNSTDVEADIFSKTFNNITKVHAMVTRINKCPDIKLIALTTLPQTQGIDARDAQTFAQGGRCVSYRLDPLVSTY